MTLVEILEDTHKLKRKNMTQELRVFLSSFWYPFFFTLCAGCGKFIRLCVGEVISWPHFANEETEFQKEEVPSLRSQR